MVLCKGEVGGKMKKWGMIVGIMLLLTACSEPEEQGVFQYKNAYVGDNSAVSNIVAELENSEQFMGLELYTVEEPYGIILQYEGISEEQALTNASYLFALVQNVEWVQFTFGEDGYELTRQEIEALYGMDIRNIHDEEKLKQEIAEVLK